MKFAYHNHALEFARLEDGRTIFDVLIEVICSTVFALLLGFGGYFVYAVSTGTPVVLFGSEVVLTAGKLVEFVGYFDYLIWPLIAMGQIISMRSRAKA